MTDHLRCDAGGCSAPPTFECACRRCVHEHDRTERFHACGDRKHKDEVEDTHLRVRDRDVVWITIAPVIKDPVPPEKPKQTGLWTPSLDLLVSATFAQCVMQAASIPEFVREFDRLSGTNLSRKGSQLELMIDDATGRTDAEVAAFIDFVRDVVWDRLQLPGARPWVK